VTPKALHRKRACIFIGNLPNSCYLIIVLVFFPIYRLI